VPGAEVHCGPYRDQDFVGVDMIAASPGVPLAAPKVREAVRAGTPVAGDIELFARALDPHERPRGLAVTGTNGKSTVTALAGAMVKSAGVDCEVAGNIGPPVLDALMQREQSGHTPDTWVLELSSFQLETTHSLAPTAATVLNLSEDHLDRYSSMDDYAAAKARIFLGDGAQVLNRDDVRSRAMALPGRDVVSFGLGEPTRAEDYGLAEHGGRTWLVHGRERLLATDEMKLPGLHNAANALAALALCRCAQLPMPPLLAALREFAGLPHRVEPVGERNGVRYYDDSKGTNVGATVAALAGLAHDHAGIVLIAGGEGKGQDFSPLREALERSARAVILIGRDAALIEAAIGATRFPVLRAQSMEEAVARAAMQARSGDAVLLSPACASFDMFRNYAHRGDMFRAAVQGLSDAQAH
jgi:UDP-N-acetylmuramoylalanine--D-glutamate ligase